jgi:hypothetical protein
VAAVEAAKARKAELLGNTEWCKKYSSGSAAEGAEMSELNRVIVGPEAQVAKPGFSPDEIEYARGLGVGEDVIQHWTTGKSVSQDYHDQVARWRTQRLNDRDFMSKFFSGDYEAKQKMAIANVVLMYPIK